jgi:hypothetical protein
MIHDWGRTVAPSALRPYFDYDRATIEVAARQVLEAGRAPVVDLPAPASVELFGTLSAAGAAVAESPDRGSELVDTPAG